MQRKWNDSVYPQDKANLFAAFSLRTTGVLIPVSLDPNSYPEKERDLIKAIAITADLVAVKSKFKSMGGLDYSLSTERGGCENGCPIMVRRDDARVHAFVYHSAFGTHAKKEEH